MERFQVEHTVILKMHFVQIEMLSNEWSGI